ncbi:MAG: tyrosine-type recombinase/integrase [Rubrobacter sp.]|nr:tyrosine-type recombinase/integrase [Rubrobacter sp.]
MNSKNLIARSFKPILVKVGLPKTERLHDLRHTCATLLLSRGVPQKFVHELLGHANISITLHLHSRATRYG